MINIDKLMSKFSSLLQENGEWSSMRFSFLLSVIISNLVIFGLWLGLSINVGQLLAVPESVLVLYAVANGLSISGKLIQKNKEGSK